MWSSRFQNYFAKFNARFDAGKGSMDKTILASADDPVYESYNFDAIVRTALKRTSSWTSK